MSEFVGLVEFDEDLSAFVALRDMLNRAGLLKSDYYILPRNLPTRPQEATATPKVNQPSRPDGDNAAQPQRTQLTLWA